MRITREWLHITRKFWRTESWESNCSIYIITRDNNFCPTCRYLARPGPTLMGQVLPGPIRNRVGYGFYHFQCRLTSNDATASKIIVGSRIWPQYRPFHAYGQFFHFQCVQLIEPNILGKSQWPMS